MKFKIGKYYYCDKNLYFSDNSLDFVKGKKYKLVDINSDGLVFINEGGLIHSTGSPEHRDGWYHQFSKKRKEKLERILK